VSLIIGCLVCGIGGATTPLVVVSFNLRYGTALDGENAWPKRRELMVETIRTMNPDIMGTQECLEFQAQYLAEAMPEYAWIGVGRETDGKGEMSALFYRKDALTAEESGHYWLSETPEVHGSRSWNTSCTRMVTWARFRHAGTGAAFHVLNTHFDHRSEEARVQSARLIVQRLLSLPREMPVILTGDFNANAETSAAWKILVQGGFKDACLLAGERLGPDVTFGGFKAPPDVKRQRIDWILVRNAGSVQRYETVTFNKDGRYPSDHYPVSAVILIPGTP